MISLIREELELYMRLMDVVYLKGKITSVKH